MWVSGFYLKGLLQWVNITINRLCLVKTLWPHNSHRRPDLLTVQGLGLPCDHSTASIFPLALYFSKNEKMFS